MDERRRSSRQRSFLHGCLYFNNRRSAIDCLVRDISRTGARLLFSQTATIPDVVDLHIPQKEQWLKARVQWRSGEEVGVAFEQAPAVSTSGTGDLAQRVEQLENELAALKRVIKRLKIDPEAA